MTADARTRTRLRRGVSLAAGCLLLSGVAPSIASADIEVPAPDLTPGQAVIWGGPANMQDVLKPPAGLDDTIAIAASDTPGSYSNLALKSDGTVVGWGLNTYGEATVPSDLSNVVAVDTGAGFSMALRSDGSVVAWGTDDAGQLDVPSDLGPVKAIAAGGYLGYRGYGVPYSACGFALALRPDGTVVRWGQDRDGLACDQDARLDPPADLTDVIAISAGDRQALALKSDGTVVAWGPGMNSGLDGTPPESWSDITAISAGAGNSLGLRSDHSVVAYGIWGESGPPQGVADVTALSAAHTDLFLHSDTTISAYPGTLGLPSGTGFQAVSAGNDYGLAIEAVTSPPEPTPTQTASPEPTPTQTTPLPRVPALGSAQLQPSVDSNPPGSAEAFQYTASGDALASTFHVFVDEGNKAESVLVGVYADNGGEPGTLLSTGRSTTVVSGEWNRIAIAPVALKAGTRYWLALLGPQETGVLTFRDRPDGSGGPTRLSTQTDLSSWLPGRWRSSTTFANSPASAYLD
jgi:hypothetical protein